MPKTARRFGSLDLLESRTLLSGKAAALRASAAGPPPTVAVADVTVPGRRDTVASALVVLSGPSASPVRVGYRTTPVTAVGSGRGRDFASTQGVLVIKPGATSGTIKVKVVGDPKVSSDRVFDVDLTRAVNASLATSGASARVVIRDDAPSGLGRPTLWVSDPTALVGDAATFVVSLSAPTTHPVSLRYRPEPGTAPASGYSAAQGTVTIPAGQTSATITVPAPAPASAAVPQQFPLVVSALANADLASGTGSAVAIATILAPTVVPAPPVASPPVTTPRSPNGPVLGSAADPLKIMPLGDSITYGVTSITNTPGGYRARLYRDLTAAGTHVQFVGSSTLNPDPNLPAAAQGQEGHLGYLISGMGTYASYSLDTYIDQWLAPDNGVNPDVILLMTGANNIVGNYRVAEASRDLAALVTHIASLRPTAKILVSTLTPQLPPVDELLVQQYNQALGGPTGVIAQLQARGENVALVDAGDALTVADLSDWVHPTAAGYVKLGDAWFQALRNNLPAGTVAG